MDSCIWTTVNVKQNLLKTKQNIQKTLRYSSITGLHYVSKHIFRFEVNFFQCLISFISQEFNFLERLSLGFILLFPKTLLCCPP